MPTREAQAQLRSSTMQTNGVAKQRTPGEGLVHAIAVAINTACYRHDQSDRYGSIIKVIKSVLQKTMSMPVDTQSVEQVQRRSAHTLIMLHHKRTEVLVLRMKLSDGHLYDTPPPLENPSKAAHCPCSAQEINGLVLDRGCRSARQASFFKDSSTNIC